jgi:anti-sigma B factor antagonist/stage II sporulation protein AA (anti-sigma F factor antagonist)
MTVGGAVAGEAPSFSVKVEPAREVVWVAPVGELDLATVPVLRGRVQELIDVGFGRLVIDLRQLSFLDVRGVRLLLCLAEQARRDGLRLSLIQGSDAVRRICALTGLVDQLPFCSPVTLAGP